MPQFKEPLTTGLQYLGTLGTGLFDPGNTGAANLQVRINSIRFNTALAVSFSFSSVDPDDATNKTLLFTDTGSDLSDDSVRLLSTNNDGQSWLLVFESGVLGADAFLVVDYDFQGTEG